MNVSTVLERRMSSPLGGGQFCAVIVWHCCETIVPALAAAAKALLCDCLRPVHTVVVR